MCVCVYRCETILKFVCSIFCQYPECYNNWAMLFNLIWHKKNKTFREQCTIIEQANKKVVQLLTVFVLISVCLLQNRQPFSQDYDLALTSLMLCVFITGNTYSLMQHTINRFLRNISWKFYITLTVFAKRLLNGNSSKKIVFRISFRSKCLSHRL